MSTLINRDSRATFAVLVTGLLLVGGIGCATTDTETAKSKRVNPIVEQAKAHGHTPWRYRGFRGRRSMRPRYKAQKPIFPCKQCDGGIDVVSKEVDGQ